tara:strand:+ start:67850 stop:68494 length:645 start_codon:yes stop_codon:yes gene_type:complete
MNHQAELLEQQLIEERAKVAALEAEKAARQQAVPSEFEPDSLCIEADGCPTELAVLKRYWRSTQADAPAPAERVSQNDWPKCDYCGEVPDCHPWHGSGMFNLVDNPHIHACTDCRHLLPTPAERVGQEPVVWRCPRRDANDDWVYDYSRRKVCDYCEPLFTAPQPSPAPAAPDVAGLVEVSGKILAKLQHPTHSVNILDTEALEKALATFHREG